MNGSFLGEATLPVLFCRPFQWSQRLKENYFAPQKKKKPVAADLVVVQKSKDSQKFCFSL